MIEWGAAAAAEQVSLIGCISRLEYSTNAASAGPLALVLYLFELVPRSMLLLLAISIACNLIWRD